MGKFAIRRIVVREGGDRQITKILEPGEYVFTEQRHDDFFMEGITVCTVVGKNGCGKSSLIELLFKYNESATGIYLVHTQHLQALALELSPLASEADVLLYAAFVNAVLAKHKRARLYDKYAPLKGLTDDDVLRMIKDRKAYLKRLLATKDGFTMEGLNADFTLQVAHLRPAISPDMQVLELQQQFVAMQWEIEEDEEL